MEKTTPVRKSHTNTADLLTWSENPPENSPAIGSAASSARSRQVRMIFLKKYGILIFFWRTHYLIIIIFLMKWKPSDGIQKVVFGGQVTDEEVESLNKRWMIQLSRFWFISFCLFCFMCAFYFVDLFEQMRGHLMLPWPIIVRRICLLVIFVVFPLIFWLYSSRFQQFFFLCFLSSYYFV